MGKKETGNTGAAPSGPKAGREDRLKAALKANMARRKAQMRARAAAPGDRPAEKDKD